MSGDAKKLLYGSGLKVKLLVEKLEVASHVHLSNDTAVPCVR
jgi:hypothetical protein